jgi:hypothetical protein
VRASLLQTDDVGEFSGGSLDAADDEGLVLRGGTGGGQTDCGGEGELGDHFDKVGILVCSGDRDRDRCDWKVLGWVGDDRQAWA